MGPTPIFRSFILISDSRKSKTEIEPQGGGRGLGGQDRPYELNYFDIGL